MTTDNNFDMNLRPVVFSRKTGRIQYLESDGTPTDLPGGDPVQQEDLYQELRRYALDAYYEED